ncbi:PadR family transcriptional regulator [Actinomadura sp. NPDC048394]|uniref:PadR family transcriptional regulator n=1 Tax=Actinomadura sp. NPDC048394 TaxID=3158223 RepID=UPI0033E4E4AD
MSLRHALLGLIAEMDGASGYDLMKVFEISLGTVWQATQSQLYGELGKLTDSGLIEVSAEGPRGRKEYAITGAGRDELRHWMVETDPKPHRRDEVLLRVFFLDQIAPEEALGYLDRMIDALTGRLDELARLEEIVPWEEEGGLTGNGRLTMEYGKRFMAMRRDWFVWAREQYRERRPATEARASSGASSGAGGASGASGASGQGG